MRVRSRITLMMHPGYVYWLFGFSGAGKSSLAAALQRDLRDRVGENALMIDGDRLRSGLCAGLGFSDADRTENLRRAAEVARLGVESGQVVIAAFITPREAQRRMIANIVGRERLAFIHVQAALATCRRRDVKGLYAGAAQGLVPQMTGVSADFEPPAGADLQLHTDCESLEESSARLAAFAQNLGIRRAGARVA